MPRIRTIKPDFWTDSLMVQLPALTRLLYIALWNAADDYGCLRDEPERLAMELMPREDPIEIDGHLQLLIACGRITLMADDGGRTFLRIEKWEHQKVDHPGKSRLLDESSRKLAIPQETRRRVATKYGCQPGETVSACCFYCDAPGSVHWFRRSDGRPSAWVYFAGLELDHVVAEAQGGENAAENFVLACRKCNRSKGTKDWVEFFCVVNSREPSRVLASPRAGSVSLPSTNSGTRAPEPVNNGDKSARSARRADGSRRPTDPEEIERRRRQAGEIAKGLAAGAKV